MPNYNWPSQAMPGGRKRHFCPDWDFMWIDEDDPEFECCTCYGMPDLPNSQEDDDEAVPPHFNDPPPALDTKGEAIEDDYSFLDK